MPPIGSARSAPGWDKIDWASLAFDWFEARLRQLICRGCEFGGAPPSSRGASSSASIRRQNGRFVESHRAAIVPLLHTRNGDPATNVPRVSVIVAFRDVRRHLDRCVESLLGQHVPRESFEILFIDNNSTDGGNATVTARSHIRLLVEPKPGVYTARNRGVKEARGEILAFTDPDCQVEPDWVEHITSAMRDPGVGIVLGQRIPPTDDGPLKRVMAYESQKTAYVTRRGVAELFFGHANNMAIRREVMDRVGPFLERSRGSDTILVRRAVDAYGPGIVRYCPEMTVRHLEVSDLATYYRKNRIYGQSNKGVAEEVRYRPLTLRERLQVFRETVRDNRFSALQGAQLLLLLIPGMLCYEWGRRVTNRSLVGWRRAGASSAGAAFDSKDAQSR